MTLEKRVKTLQRLDELIRRKATGTSADLARRLGISTATLYRQLAELRELGAPIAYNRFRQVYYYEEDFDLMALIFRSMVQS